jgi:hypothetical protein
VRKHKALGHCGGGKIMKLELFKFEFHTTLISVTWSDYREGIKDCEIPVVGQFRYDRELMSTHPPSL